MAREGFRPTRRNALFWTSWAVALGFELVMMGVLWGGHIYGWEQSVARAFQDVPGRQVVFDLSSTITNTISVEFALLFAVIVGGAYLLRFRAEAALLLLAFPLHVLAQFPKFFLERPRPSSAFEGIEGVGGLNSFPSGHSEFVVTFYGFIAYLLIGRASRPWQRWAIAVAFLAFALATGFGRVALGRHWPVDVLSSYVIGLGILSGLIWLHTTYRRVNARAGQPPFSDEALQ
jgi:membrane-associated phospholipid phosphatase